jgi:hypothetical protein
VKDRYLMDYFPNLEKVIVGVHFTRYNSYDGESGIQMISRHRRHDDGWYTFGVNVTTPDGFHEARAVLDNWERLPYVSGPYRMLWDFQDAHDTAQSRREKQQMLRADIDKRQQRNQKKGQPGNMAGLEKKYKRKVYQAKRAAKMLVDAQRRLEEAAGGSTDEFLQSVAEQLETDLVVIATADRSAMVAEALQKAEKILAIALDPKESEIVIARKTLAEAAKSKARKRGGVESESES